MAQQVAPAHPNLGDILPDGINLNEVKAWIQNNAARFVQVAPGIFQGQVRWVKNNREYSLSRRQTWAPFIELYEINRVDRNAAGNEIHNQAGIAARMMYQIGLQAPDPNAPNRFYYYSYPMGHQGLGWQHIGGKRYKKNTRKSRKSKKSRKNRK